MVDELRHDFEHRAVRLHRTNVVVKHIGNLRERRRVNTGEHCRERFHHRRDPGCVHIDAKRPDEMALRVTNENRGTSDQTTLMAVIKVRHHVPGVVRRPDDLREQMLKAFTHLSAGHRIVDDINHRVLRRRQVVQHDLHVVAEGADDHVGDGNILCKNRFDHEDDEGRKP